MTTDYGIDDHDDNSETAAKSKPPIPANSTLENVRNITKFRRPSDQGDSRVQSSTGPNGGERKAKEATRNPNQNNRLAAAVNFDPSLIESSFDLVYELSTNIDNYRGDECLTLCRVPGYVKSSLERFQYNFPSSPLSKSSTSKPGISPIIAACIIGGLKSFRCESSLINLIDIQKTLLDQNQLPSETTRGVLYDAVKRNITSFSLDVLPAGLSAHCNINVTLPLNIKNALVGFSSSISLNLSTVATLCVAESLRAESATLDDHSLELEKAIETFLVMTDWRARSLKSMLEMLKEQGQKKGTKRTSIR